MALVFVIHAAAVLVVVVSRGTSKGFSAVLVRFAVAFCSFHLLRRPRAATCRVSLSSPAHLHAFPPIFPAPHPLAEKRLSLWPEVYLCCNCADLQFLLFI